VLGGVGVGGYEIVTKDFSLVGLLGFFGTQSGECPMGKRVLSAGAATLTANSGGGVSLGTTSTVTFGNGSFPSDADTWTVSVNFTGSSSVAGVRLVAVCAY
jgi:hypothetical protein